MKKKKKKKIKNAALLRATKYQKIDGHNALKLFLKLGRETPRV